MFIYSLLIHFLLFTVIKRKDLAEPQLDQALCLMDM